MVKLKELLENLTEVGEEELLQHLLKRRKERKLKTFFKSTGPAPWTAIERITRLTHPVCSGNFGPG